MHHKRWFSPSSCPMTWLRTSGPMPPSHGPEVSGVPLNQLPVPGLLLLVTNAKSALGTSSKMCWGEALPGGDLTLKKACASFPLLRPSYQGLSLSSSIPLPPPVGPSASSRALASPSQLEKGDGVPKPGQFGRDPGSLWPCDFPVAMLQLLGPASWAVTRLGFPWSPSTRKEAQAAARMGNPWLMPPGAWGLSQPHPRTHLHSQLTC